MKKQAEYLINSRPLTTYASIHDELILKDDQNYLFDLSYLSLINISGGDKAIDFLQGQLTCDLRLVSDFQIAQGAQCNLKGRILALLDVLNWNGIKLVLPGDLVESTIASLMKTAQLSRVSLNKEEQYRIYGFYLQNQDDILPEATFFPSVLYAQSYTVHYCYYHLGNGFYIFVVNQGHMDELIKPFVEQERLLGSLTWHTLRLKHHQIDIYPESRGLFLPHRLNLHETKYISFDKGCYKGQEIIARTHYRATLKHELKLFSIETDQKIFSGQKLFKVEEGTELGELIDYSILGENRYLIAVSILKEPVQSFVLENNTVPVRLLGQSRA